MKAPRNPVTPKSNGGGGPEFGAVTIDFKPGPDSKDRLRRLFSLLLEHATAKGQVTPGMVPPDYPPANADAPTECPSRHSS